VDLGRQPSRNHSHVAIRPDDITITGGRFVSNNRNSFRGIVTAMVDQGFYYEAHVQVGKITFKSLISKKSLLELNVLDGTEVFLSFETTVIHTL